MGREVRMVPPGWQHPKDENGKYIPLLRGGFAEADSDWNEGYAAWQRGEVENYGDGPKWKPKDAGAGASARYTDYAGPRPSPDDYMPEWSKGEATMLVMYEDTSEGTPISPAFSTPEELARWLTDNGASAFADMTATYEEWLATCRRGGAVSAVLSTAHGLQSGVAAALD